ncbi:MAG: ribosome maturation factor RimP, partial [Clostridia bacterium]|nr:ribosome maturation factor RimP [Clostridia bacterium]
MPAKKGGVAAVVAALAQPVAEELGLELWDVEFVKEGASWFLRIFLDKDGGITLDDCERFHRRIDPVIDEADPVAQSYYLEVSSPGVERELKKPGHFEHELGKPVRVKLFHPDGSGRKELTGVLEAFSDAE